MRWRGKRNPSELRCSWPSQRWPFMTAAERALAAPSIARKRAGRWRRALPGIRTEPAGFGVIVAITAALWMAFLVAMVVRSMVPQ